MNKEEMVKEAYTLMVKNNPDEAIKNLIRLDKELDKKNKIVFNVIEEKDYIFNKLTCEKGYLKEKLNKKEDRINKAIEYIEKYCIDDDFYVNLTKKEKCIIDVLDMVKGDSDE